MAAMGSRYSQPGDLDQQQTGGHAERRVHVGEQVGGVGLERGRLRAPRDRVEDLLRDHEVHDARRGHDGDAQPHVVDVRAVDDLRDALVDDHRRGGDDEQRLDDPAEVLDLLVAVVVVHVRGLGGLAHRVEGDEGGDQVGARVQRLGDDGDRPREDADRELEGDERRVGGDGDRRGARLEPVVGEVARASGPYSGLRTSIDDTLLSQPFEEGPTGQCAVAGLVLVRLRPLGHSEV